MDVYELIKSCDFEAVGECSTSVLNAREDVRSMCNAEACQAFGHKWACPPACGDLDHWREIYAAYERCIVFQTVQDMEDEFDFESIMMGEGSHKERIVKLHSLVREHFPQAILLSAGTCTICNECTYPDAPCRFPDRMLVSMEASGLLVSEVCTSANIPYNHGSLKMAFTSCLLL